LKIERHSGPAAGPVRNGVGSLESAIRRLYVANK
jgi:hypothetical protein